MANDKAGELFKGCMAWKEDGKKRILRKKMVKAKRSKYIHKGLLSDEIYDQNGASQGGGVHQ